MQVAGSPDETPELEIRLGTKVLSGYFPIPVSFLKDRLTSGSTPKMVSFKELRVGVANALGGKWERISSDPEGVCVLLNRRVLALSGRGLGHSNSRPVNAQRWEPAMGLRTAVTVVINHSREAAHPLGGTAIFLLLVVFFKKTEVNTILPGLKGKACKECLRPPLLERAE